MTSTNKIEYFRHNLGTEERDAVASAMSDLFLTTGPRVTAFEGELVNYLGRAPATGPKIHALGLSSCTAALHLALLANGIGLGDEVITTPITFIATANAIEQVGAIPVFVDIDEKTGNIDIAAAASAITKKTKAIIVVHLYGEMCDMRAFRTLCDTHNIVLIEDAAHSLESSQNSIRPGQLSDAACFSFHALKAITSAEGGALVSRHQDVVDRARTLSLHGMSKGAAKRHEGNYVHWDMVSPGYKCNMSSLAAAMLSPQLRRVTERRDQRIALANRYRIAFVDIPGIETPRCSEGSAQLMFTILVAPQLRDAFLEGFGNSQIGVAVNFRAIHTLTHYREKHLSSLPKSERFGDRTITLPLYPRLLHAEQDRVIATTLELLRNLTSS